MPCRNVAHVIEKQLDALSKQQFDGDWELICADNGSTDNTNSVIQSFSSRIPSLRIVDASRAPGINVARNDGFKAAKFEVIAYCDADDIADSNWIAEISKAADAHDLIGGAIHTNSLNDAEALERVGKHPCENGLITRMGFLPHATGANFAIKREVLETLGGWNENYVGGADDIEMCWRAQLANHSLGFAPNAIMHYKYRESAKSTADQARSYGRSDVKLYAQFRSLGVPRRSFKQNFRSLAKVLYLSAISVIKKDPAGRAVYERGRMLGHIEGSIKNKCLFL